MNFDQNPPNNQPSSSLDNQTPQEINPPQPRVQVRFNGSKPVVIYVILGITVLAYLFQVGSQYLTGIDLGFALGGKVNELIIAGQYWRLFTPMLLHGSIIHLLFNMYALIILGRGLEFNFGRLRFIAIICFSRVCRECDVISSSHPILPSDHPQRSLDYWQQKPCSFSRTRSFSGVRQGRY